MSAAKAQGDDFRLPLASLASHGERSTPSSDWSDTSAPATPFVAFATRSGTSEQHDTGTFVCAFGCVNKKRPFTDGLNLRAGNNRIPMYACRPCSASFYALAHQSKRWKTDEGARGLHEMRTSRPLEFHQLVVRLRVREFDDEPGVGQWTDRLKSITTFKTSVTQSVSIEHRQEVGWFDRGEYVAYRTFMQGCTPDLATREFEKAVADPSTAKLGSGSGIRIAHKKIPTSAKITRRESARSLERVDGVADIEEDGRRRSELNSFGRSGEGEVELRGLGSDVLQGSRLASDVTASIEQLVGELPAPRSFLPEQQDHLPQRTLMKSPSNPNGDRPHPKRPLLVGEPAAKKAHTAIVGGVQGLRNEARALIKVTLQKYGAKTRNPVNSYTDILSKVLMHEDTTALPPLPNVEEVVTRFTANLAQITALKSSIFMSWTMENAHDELRSLQDAAKYLQLDATAIGHSIQQLSSIHASVRKIRLSANQALSRSIRMAVAPYSKSGLPSNFCALLETSGWIFSGQSNPPVTFTPSVTAVGDGVEDNGHFWAKPQKFSQEKYSFGSKFSNLSSGEDKGRSLRALIDRTMDTMENGSLGVSKIITDSTITTTFGDFVPPGLRAAVGESPLSMENLGPSLVAVPPSGHLSFEYTCRVFGHAHVYFGARGRALLIIIPVTQLCNEGISLDAAWEQLSNASKSVVTAVSAKWDTVEVGSGDAVWVPFGYCTMVVTPYHLDRHVGIVAPVFGKTCWRNVQTRVARQLFAFNARYLTDAATGAVSTRVSAVTVEDIRTATLVWIRTVIRELEAETLATADVPAIEDAAPTVTEVAAAIPILDGNVDGEDEEDDVMSAAGAPHQFAPDNSPRVASLTPRRRDLEETAGTAPESRESLACGPCANVD